MIATDKNLESAVKLLGEYSSGRFDVWALAGRDNAKKRAIVMSALMGRKMTQAQSGVFAIRDTFFARAGIDGSCTAVREDNFMAFCKSL